MFKRWVSLLAWIVFCGAVTAGQAQAQNLVVFAASSLKEALDEVSRNFSRNGQTKTVISYAASSMLAKQIESGAPADVFISADLDWMDYLDQRKLIRAGSRLNLLGNRLVLIAPADRNTAVVIKAGFSLARLLGDGRLALADPDAVPAGKYGRAALMKLGVWDSVSSKVVRAENVRAALNFVARGESPFGIVYGSDAQVEKKVRIAGEFPRDTYPAIIYPAGIVMSSKSAVSQPYLEYLKSREARAIFEHYGFIVLQ